MAKLKNLYEPRYTQPIVLRVTGLNPSVLQAWVARGKIELVEPNPGYGKSRLYAAADIMMLAIMRRMNDFKIAPELSFPFASDALDEFEKKDRISWDAYCFLHFDDRPRNKIAYRSLMDRYGFVSGDPAHMRVSEYVEPDRHLFQRRMRDEQRPMESPITWPIYDPSRKALAAQGMHAEPVLIFPLGEIMNGALAQLEAIEDREGKAGIQ